MSNFADRLKEYHRSLRRKRGGDELSMQQVAYFFGGLYAIIHLLQYFDLWTLLILAIVGYVLYRQVQNMIRLAAEAGEEPVPQAPSQQMGAKGGKTKGAKKIRGENQTKS
mmetsp:Transcript_65247/g.144186  ORF Transcript_65247/g.144186 Transcript_65247/m.144186 type:complete len:110 (+) Transcript_65247:121-450(+)